LGALAAAPNARGDYTFEELREQGPIFLEEEQGD